MLLIDSRARGWGVVRYFKMCQNEYKYQFANCAVCAYAHIVRKRPWCALIGACALIGMNTVF